MTLSIRFKKVAWIFTAFFPVTAGRALAFQGCDGAAGIVLHQFSYVFFFLSMGALAHWIKNRSLSAREGWREIRVASILFMLWALAAFFFNLAGSQAGWISESRLDLWTLHLQPAGGIAPLAWLYYIARFDYLLCVSAMFFLYRGAVRLSARNSSGQGEKT